jgi:hypothetical protein
MFGVKDLAKRIAILGIILLPWEIVLAYFFLELFV